MYLTDSGAVWCAEHDYNVILTWINIFVKLIEFKIKYVDMEKIQIIITFYLMTYIIWRCYIICTIYIDLQLCNTHQMTIINI